MPSRPAGSAFFAAASAASLAACALLTAACPDPDGGDVDAGPDAGTPVVCPTPRAIGTTLTVVADSQLFEPFDLAFNPREADQLWIVNHLDDTTLIVTGATGDVPTQELRRDEHSDHFMENVSSIAFGGDQTSFGIPGTLGTCQDGRNTRGDTEDPNDYMGPTLWSSDLSIFAAVDPHMLGSHLDMLHQSPLCVGLAHERDNVYWTFGGVSGSIFRCDFQTDHDIGQDDHSDGRISRWLTGEVERVDDVPGHLFWVDDTLYIADTGGGRILLLDTASGTRGADLQPFGELLDAFYEQVDATSRVVVSGLDRPAGIEVQDGVIYVSVNGTSHITAFCEDGSVLSDFDTGLPSSSLGGLTFGPDGKLYFTDILGDRVFRLDP